MPCAPLLVAGRKGDLNIKPTCNARLYGRATCRVISLLTITFELAVGVAMRSRRPRMLLLLRRVRGSHLSNKCLTPKRRGRGHSGIRRSMIFLVVVVIKRQLGTLKRYLKISAEDARGYQTTRARAFQARQKAKTKRIRRTGRRV